MNLEIKTPSRIHATLIDMNGSLGRVDGGFGFTIENPGWVIKFEANSDDSVNVYCGEDSDTDHFRNLVMQIMEGMNITSRDASCDIHITSQVLEHVGLGSKTQFLFGIAEGLSRLTRKAPEARTRAKYAAYTGRGGTSGIGITSFFHGGAILDGGHTFGKNGEKSTFLPSSASRAGPAPVLYHRSMPREWQVVLAIPELHKGAHDQQEVNIFQEYCPVSIQDVRNLCHLLLMVILPAIETRSFSSLCEGINRIQSTGFKKVEIDIRGDSIKTLMEQWKDAGAPCVGMSSFGPTLYALARNDQQAEEIRDDALDLGYPIRECIITRFNNHGAEVKLLDE